MLLIYPTIISIFSSNQRDEKQHDVALTINPCTQPNDFELNFIIILHSEIELKFWNWKKHTKKSGIDFIFIEIKISFWDGKSEIQINWVLEVIAYGFSVGLKKSSIRLLR